MSWRRIWLAALSEWASAIRSRRAIVVMVLFLACSLLCMNGAISILGKLERELATVLQLDAGGGNGVISTALWKSEPFQRMVRSCVSDSLVYDDILGCHPAELIYAWFVFLLVPLLTVWTAADRVANDLRSGAVKYMLVRVTRLEWSLGKYLGLALLLLGSLLFGAVAAWLTAVFRLADTDLPRLLPAMLGWSLKAWVLSLGWLGVSLGVSHLTMSGAKASAIATIAIVGFYAFVNILEGLVGYSSSAARLLPLTWLAPSSAAGSLWRSGLEPVTAAAVWSLALGLFYLMLGHAVFARRDAR